MVEQRDLAKPIAHANVRERRFFPLDYGQRADFAFEHQKHRRATRAPADDMAELRKTHELEVVSKRFKLQRLQAVEELNAAQGRRNETRAEFGNGRRS